MTCRVFNLGIPCSNSSQHLKYLKEIIKRHKSSDLVIVLTGVNDSWNAADTNILLSERFNILNRVNVFLSELRIYKMLKLLFIDSSNKNVISARQYYKQVRRSSVGEEEKLRKQLEYNLQQMIKLAKLNNIGIILQNYPGGDLYGGNFSASLTSSRLHNRFQWWPPLGIVYSLLGRSSNLGLRSAKNFEPWCKNNRSMSKVN